MKCMGPGIKFIIVNNLFKVNFNGILVNRYADGKDYIGSHSDDEKNLTDVL